MYAVTPRLRTEVDYRIAHACSGAPEDFVLVCDSEAEHIDQWIQRIDIIKSHLTTDGRHSHAVAVSRDAGDDPFHEMPVLRRIESAESQCIEQCDRSCSHRKHVAKNAADSRCRSLVGFNERGMVV